MKALFSIFFLLVMTLVLIKPFSPYAEYALNKDYIIAELCINRDVPMMHCNGKCHLAQMIKQEQDRNVNYETVVPQSIDFVVGLLPDTNRALLSNSGRLTSQFIAVPTRTKQVAMELPPPELLV